MERQQAYKVRIVSDPKIMLGKPTIAGTRITVELILELLSSGMSAEDILAEYPHLNRESISAALAFAADVLQSDQAYSLVDAP